LNGGGADYAERTTSVVPRRQRHFPIVAHGTAMDRLLLREVVDPEQKPPAVLARWSVAIAF
jgi:hypothetical protein